jgi:hypothetical protein
LTRNMAVDEQVGDNGGSSPVWLSFAHSGQFGYSSQEPHRVLACEGIGVSLEP